MKKRVKLRTNWTEEKERERRREREAGEEAMVLLENDAVSLIYGAHLYARRP